MIQLMVHSLTTKTKFKGSLSNELVVHVAVVICLQRGKEDQKTLKKSRKNRKKTIMHISSTDMLKRK